VHLPVPSKSRQAGDDLALVVGCPTSKELAISLGKPEGVTFPELERVGRLDIVMVVEEQRRRTFDEPLAVDDRRTRCLVQFGADPLVFEKLAHEGRRFDDTAPFGCDRWHGHETFECAPSVVHDVLGYL
jgi:hypothetical protein